MKRDVGEGLFTAHNWTVDRQMRRIHGRAEDQAEAEGRPFSDIESRREIPPDRLNSPVRNAATK